MISCKEYVEKKKEILKNKVDKMKDKPCLVVAQIGNDEASNSYIKGKKKDCTEIGIKMIHEHIMDDSMSQEKVENIIRQYDADDTVDGIIIQLPIPKQYNKNRLQKCIRPSKDVDGFKRNSWHRPCTPLGIMNWLKYNKVDLSSKDVAVIGRSDIVGKPLVNMMIEQGATVTCCNSKTENLKYYTQNADIVISAIGKTKYFDSTYFKKGQIIIDVGINKDEYGKLCGDVDGTYIYDSYVTPVPGSVGLLTRCQLVNNVVSAYYKRRKYNEKRISN